MGHAKPERGWRRLEVGIRASPALSTRTLGNQEALKRTRIRQERQGSAPRWVWTFGSMAVLRRFHRSPPSDDVPLWLGPSGPSGASVRPAPFVDFLCFDEQVQDLQGAQRPRCSSNNESLEEMKGSRTSRIASLWADGNSSGLGIVRLPYYTARDGRKRGLRLYLDDMIVDLFRIT